ncbi:MAG: hypothetical protein K1X75_16845 [Leptospirales bacterium]|nr:hypothetical protein [Leptospirales bacterium]
MKAAHEFVGATLSVVCSDSGAIIFKLGDESELLYPEHFSFTFGESKKIRILWESLGKALLPRLFQQGNLKLAVTIRGGFLFGVYVVNQRSTMDSYSDFEAWDERLANAVAD